MLMYEAWRKRMDVVEPLTKEHWQDYGAISRITYHTVRRPKWQHLTSVQQAVWRDVAREISGVLADAMGAA